MQCLQKKNYVGAKKTKTKYIRKRELLTMTIEDEKGKSENSSRTSS